MKQIMHFTINGLDYDVAVEPNTTLVDLLREELHITGVKKGCNEGECGACSVLCDDRVIPSCTTLAADVQDTRIVTIEGLKQGNLLHPVQQAFIDCFAIQCGFCTPGMILSVVALLNYNIDPTEEEMRDYLRGNICRCTGYTKIIDAINQAKETLRQQGVEPVPAASDSASPRAHAGLKTAGAALNSPSVEK